MKRTIWSKERWRAYIDGLCEVRRTLWEFVHFPECAGLRAADLSPFARAHTLLVASMIDLETTIERHIGGEDATGPTISFCQGRYITGLARDQSDCSIVPCKGRTKGGLPALPYEEWITWGTKAKRGHTMLCHAQCAVQYALGITKQSRHISRLDQVERHLAKGRCRLDSLLIAQYPNWCDATRCFYGDPEERIYAPQDAPQTDRAYLTPPRHASR